MVRLARTHLRFGTCERLLYLRERLALERLLRHVVTVYYPQIAATLRRWNLPEPPVRSTIERIWSAIEQRDDWQPLHDWLDQCGSSHSARSECSALQRPPLGSV